MVRKFFVGSVGKPGEEYSEENRVRCISLQAHVMHEDTIQKGVFERVNAGDICFLKYNDQLICFGEVVDRFISNDESMEGWTYHIKVKTWFFYDVKEKKKGVNKIGIKGHTFSGAGQQGTVKEIDSEYGLQKMKEIAGENNALYMKVKKEINMSIGIKLLQNLLEKNKNLILTGAPGTGKTYLAKQIAQQIIIGEDKENLSDENEKQFIEQCEFVQFHPSYDYTDFVEGLRPTQGENESPGFERKDGVFKEFCAKALENYLNSKQDPKAFQVQMFNRSMLDEFIQDAIDNETSFNTTKKNSFSIINYTEKRIIININLPNIKNQEIRLPKKDLIKLLEHDDEVTLKDIKDICKRKVRIQSDSYVFSLYKKLKEQIDSKGNTHNLNSISELKLKNYVFIIDEINRGEVSKIFGELFFSIDPGYRGSKGKVRTQYANMQEEPNDFDEALGIVDESNCGYFFVPENVYIIGTMNDIDRSVESMDFAFRRRFAFKEITADDSKKMLDSDESWGKDENGRSRKPNDEVISLIKSKMDAINRIIWHKKQDGESEEDKCIEGLSSAYHIGASYFLKLVNYQIEEGSFDFDQLWDNHLEGLLFEYLRGMTDIQEKIIKLAKAFGYSKMAKYE